MLANVISFEQPAQDFYQGGFEPRPSHVSENQVPSSADGMSVGSSPGDYYCRPPLLVHWLGICELSFKRFI